MLCEICSKIQPANFWPMQDFEEDKQEYLFKNYNYAGGVPGQFYYFHYSSIADLKASSRTGCHLCTILYSGFVRCKRSWEERRGKVLSPPPGPILLCGSHADYSQPWVPKRDDFIIVQYGEKSYGMLHNLRLMELPSE